MKKILILTITILVALTLAACGAADTNTATPTGSSNSSGVSMSIVYLTFEKALLSSTDVVIVNYVGHRPFGETLTEFEFTVVDRILGNAADTIFIYSGYSPERFSFIEGTDYLLALERLWRAHGRTHPDGFLLINDLIINLDDPAGSMMYNEPVTLHATELDFDNRSLDRDEIIAFIAEKTANNPPGRDHIRSEDIVDIITGSPYVLVVEIGQPRRLLSEGGGDWAETDIYHTTVVEALKGDIGVGFKLDVVFFANTVQTGERHIVAAERLSAGSTTFIFTSRNSLFSMDQLDEILEILDGQ